MIINVDSKDFCNLINFAVNFSKYNGSIKFEVDPVMNDCIIITLSKFDGRNICYARKVLVLRDLICSTFGITEIIKITINDMERSIMNYIDMNRRKKWTS